MYVSKISEVEGLIRQQDEWRNRFRSAYQKVCYSYDQPE